MKMKLSRRRLLSLAASATVVPFVKCQSIANEPTNLSAMRFGFVTYLWGKDMNLETLIENCTKSQLLGVELRTEHAHKVEPSLTASQRAEVKKRFEDSPLTLLGYGSNCEYHSSDSAVLRKNIEQTKTLLQLSHDIGGSGVKVKPNGFPKEKSRDETIEQIGKALSEVGKRASELGQQIRVEVHGGGTSELPVIDKIMQVANHPAVRVCWNCNAEDLIGEGIESNFQLVRKYFGETVHVRELDSKDYPYATLFDLLQKSSYTGWVLLEARADPADKLAAMIQQRQLFDRLTQRPE